MNRSETQTLDLGLGFRGGKPVVYARNIMQNGDFASIAHLTGSSYQNLADNDKILIEMCSDFKNDNYLKQVKEHLLKINSTLTFANDCPTGGFLDAKEVLAETLKGYPNLMSFEKEAILNNDDTLHRIYLSALKKNEDRYGMPNDFKYEIESGHLYPFIQVYSTVAKMI